MQFQTHVNDKAHQMVTAQRQAVKAALHAGAQLVSLGRYREDGPLVLRTTMPDSWHGETYDRFRHLGLSCIIPLHCEAQTMAWFTRRTR
jgi:hypothetical protein